MLATFGFLSPTTALLLLIIALVIFGPGRLPEIGKAMGMGINEFKAASERKNEDSPQDSHDGIINEKNKL